MNPVFVPPTALTGVVAIVVIYRLLTSPERTTAGDALIALVDLVAFFAMVAAVAVTWLVSLVVWWAWK